MSAWTDMDLTDVVEQVAATVWGQQRPGLAWSDLTPGEQHNCREAVLPFVVATRDALAGDVEALVRQAKAEGAHQALYDAARDCPLDDVVQILDFLQARCQDAARETERSEA